MSWIERIQTELTITTGDGKVYTPYWVNASKNVEYNLSVFDFKSLSGSLVRRGNPRGTRYAVEIGFQGDNHLDVAKAFDISASNPNPWTVTHPLYGSIICHPSALTYDDSQLNVTKLTGMLLETIAETEPTSVSISPVDKITSDSARTEQMLLQSLSGNVPVLTVGDNAKSAQSIWDIYKKVSTKIKDSADAANYFNAYNKFMGYVNSGTSETITIARAIRAFSNLPYSFSDTVANRMNMFVIQYRQLSDAVNGLFSRTSKRMFEFDGGNSISGMALTSVTNYGSEYDNANDVFPVIEALIDNYNDYLEKLDLLKTDTGDTPESYIPDAGALTELSNLISYTVNSLFSIAAKGKKQRKYTLSDDSNLILLAHKLYGNADEEKFNYLITTNNIGLNEILQLKKGRELVYYV